MTDMTEAIGVVHYKKGYKYQLVQAFKIQTTVKPPLDVHTDWIDLTKDGMLTLAPGYAWNGPNWPAIDTETFRRGSLVHDALYQLIADMKISTSMRAGADHMLRTVCVDSGMWPPRAWWVWAGVRIFGRKYATAINPTLVA
jgi:hypothetical protein